MSASSAPAAGSRELILVVDDEAHIVDLVRLYLEREGYRVRSAGSGQAALSEVRSHPPAMVILDVMLPGMDGFEVCRRLRAESQVPVLMLTARDEDLDKIIGLELGADDYLTKPFNPREVVARVRAILRRAEPAAAGEAVVHVGDLVVDAARREVTVGERQVDLRAKEFDLLLHLARHRGLVRTREQLLSQVWGYDFEGQTRTVDVHVAHLRKKIAGGTVRIETVTGVGYKLVVPGER
ncbi:MAG TPA: response regulator transcription factor [Anaerolineales bacterium]|nr:response regulator transcription factor [Anaerolineales bacterium]